MKLEIVDLRGFANQEIRSCRVEGNFSEAWQA
jgi:hypothetical protein